MRFMQLNPARGRKQENTAFFDTAFSPPRFMQLNPARGRKLENLSHFTVFF